MYINQILYGGQSWKTPDYDRRNGEVITRKITPDDLRKFEKLQLYKKPIRFSFAREV